MSRVENSVKPNQHFGTETKGAEQRNTSGKLQNQSSSTFFLASITVLFSLSTQVVLDSRPFVSTVATRNPSQEQSNNNLVAQWWFHAGQPLNLDINIWGICHLDGGCLCHKDALCVFLWRRSASVRPVASPEASSLPRRQWRTERFLAFVCDLISHGMRAFLAFHHWSILWYYMMRLSKKCSVPFVKNFKRSCFSRHLYSDHEVCPRAERGHLEPKAITKPRICHKEFGVHTSRVNQICVHLGRWQKLTPKGDIRATEKYPSKYFQTERVKQETVFSSSCSLCILVRTFLEFLCSNFRTTWELLTKLCFHNSINLQWFLCFQSRYLRCKYVAHKFTSPNICLRDKILLKKTQCDVLPQCHLEYFEILIWEDTPTSRLLFGWHVACGFLLGVRKGMMLSLRSS